MTKIQQFLAGRSARGEEILVCPCFREHGEILYGSLLDRPELSTSLIRRSQMVLRIGYQVIREIRNRVEKLVFLVWLGRRGDGRRYRQRLF